MRLDVQFLLDGFQEPAIFYRENTVRYFNEPAHILFPELKEGGPLPERLWEEDFPFTTQANVTERGTLYLLRPRVEGGELAAVSRQVRACLSPLLAAEELISSRLDPKDEELRRVMAGVSQSLYRLRRLSDHVDLLRRLEGRREVLYREGPVDLASLCRELADRVGALTAPMGVTFRLDCREECVMSLGDYELLQRMLLGLCSNACKAVKDGGEVGLRLEVREKRAVFTVWDSGAGMERERLAAIFLPQRRPGIPKPEDGTGIGLRIVREIAVLHGGTILGDVRSEGGLRMTISLPIRARHRGILRAAPEWGLSFEELVLIEMSDALPAALYHPDVRDQ